MASGDEIVLCYSCMRPLQNGQRICPRCGRDNSRPENGEDILPEGTILAGRYLIGKAIGRGGFGVTYIGYDFVFEIVVAVKEYFPLGISTRSPATGKIVPVSASDYAEGFAKGVEAFRQEAITLFRFNTPGIVRVYDYLRERGTAYIVMQYIEGPGLDREIKAHGGKIPWQRVVSLFDPLILEIALLHNRHLIHRDIKPANLKIAPEEEGIPEHLVLLDFGSARQFVSENVTKTYTAMVTPGYAPPEQYSTHGHQGPYTDVYSICATMYAAITGVVPPAPTSVLTGEAELAPIESFGLGVPASVAQAIHHGLVLQSKKRPQTMQALHDELTGKAQAPQSVQPPKPAVQKPSQAQVYSIDTSASSPKPAQHQEPSQLVPSRQVPDTTTPYAAASAQGPAKSAAPQSVVHIPKNLKVGDIIQFGSYPNDSRYQSIRKPIAWQVLYTGIRRALLITRYGLDTIPYNTTLTSVSWETCSLRKWLNEDFYRSAFTPNEQARIEKVSNKNVSNESKDIYTLDNIFLMSADEVRKYFMANKDRQCEPTEYAREKGAFIDKDGKTKWWLRSSGSLKRNAAEVSSSGIVISYGDRVSDLNIVVRPALWLQL